LSTSPDLVKQSTATSAPASEEKIASFLAIEQTQIQVCQHLKVGIQILNNYTYLLREKDCFYRRKMPKIQN
jgi:hypothetical protein